MEGDALVVVVRWERGGAEPSEHPASSRSAAAVERVRRRFMSSLLLNLPIGSAVRFGLRATGRGENGALLLLA
jgi:hypothetical protein